MINGNNTVDHQHLKISIWCHISVALSTKGDFHASTTSKLSDMRGTFKSFLIRFEGVKLEI